MQRALRTAVTLVRRCSPVVGVLSPFAASTGSLGLEGREGAAKAFPRAAASWGRWRRCGAGVVSAGVCCTPLRALHLTPTVHHRGAKKVTKSGRKPAASASLSTGAVAEEEAVVDVDEEDEGAEDSDDLLTSAAATFRRHAARRQEEEKEDDDEMEVLAEMEEDLAQEVDEDEDEDEEGGQTPRGDDVPTSNKRRGRPPKKTGKEASRTEEEDEDEDLGDSEMLLSQDELDRQLHEGSKALIHLHPDIAIEFDAEANAKEHHNATKKRALKGATGGPMESTSPAPPPVELETLSIHDPHVLWWKCRKCEHQWRSAVFARTLLKIGCPECAAKAKPAISTKYPELLERVDPKSNDPFLPLSSLTVDSKVKVWWICRACGERYVARVRDQVQRKSRCKHCGAAAGDPFDETAQKKKRKNAKVEK